MFFRYFAIGMHQIKRDVVQQGVVDMAINTGSLRMLLVISTWPHGRRVKQELGTSAVERSLYLHTGPG